MWTLDWVSVKNFVYFKEARLDLRKGLTVVRGFNRNAAKKHDVNAEGQPNASSNGSGKSLLFSVIPIILWDTVPVANRKGKNAALTGKGTELALGVTKDGVQHEIIRSGNGSSTSYRILKGGEDLLLQTIPAAKSYIKDLIPISEEEFYSFCYMDSRRPYLFCVGTPTQRLEFFSDLFRLYKYDEIREHFKSKLSRCTDAVSAVADLSRQLEKLRAKGIEGKVPDLQDRCDSLASRVKEANESYSKFHGRTLKHTSLLSNLKQLVKVQKASEALGFTETPTTRQVDAEVVEAKSQSKAYDAYRSYKHDVSVYEAKRGTLESEISASPFSGQSEKETRKALSAYTDKKSALGAQLSHAESLLEEASSERDALTKVKLSSKEREYLKSPKLLEREIKSVTSELAVLESTRESLTSIISALGGDKVCPTCGSGVDVKKLKALLADTSEPHSKALGVKASLRTTKGKLEKYAAWKKADSNYRRKHSECSQIQSDLSLLRSSEFDAKSAGKYLSHMEKLSELKAPKAVAKVDKPDASRLGRLESLLDLLSGLDKDFKPGKYTTSDIGTLEREIEDFKAQASTHSAKITELNSKLVKASVALEAATSTVREMGELQAQIEPLKVESQRAEMYKGIVDAYSSKGIKLLAVQKLADSIVANLNTYAPLLFKEAFKFECYVDANQFDLTVVRPGGITSDVRSLSGAETRAFNLLFTLSALSLVPSTQRCNILILDEPTANLDQNYKEAFMNEFLPTLSRHIPDIVVITPLSDEQYPSANQEVVIEKHGTTSKLKIVM